jgi:hypothetical protein
MNQCPNCPIFRDIPCAGLRVRRYCQLLDPANPKHDARYGRIVIERSERDAGLPVPKPAPAITPTPDHPGGMREVHQPKRCCGGAVPDPYG